MGCWGPCVVFIQERAQRLAEEKEQFRSSHRCLGPVPMYEQFVLKPFGWYHIPAALVHFVPKMPVRNIDNIDSVHLVNSVELGSCVYIYTRIFMFFSSIYSQTFVICVSTIFDMYPGCLVSEHWMWTWAQKVWLIFSNFQATHDWNARFVKDVWEHSDVSSHVPCFLLPGLTGQDGFRPADISLSCGGGTEGYTGNKDVECCGRIIHPDCTFIFLGGGLAWLGGVGRDPGI